MKIKTNRQLRRRYSLYELPKKVWSEFDYVYKDNNVEVYQIEERLEKPFTHYWKYDYFFGEKRFFKYRGRWYDTYGFRRAYGGDEIYQLGFDHWQIDSNESAVVFTRYDHDGTYLDDKIIVGYATW